MKKVEGRGMVYVLLQDCTLNLFVMLLSCLEEQRGEEGWGSSGRGVVRSVVGGFFMVWGRCFKAKFKGNGTVVVV